MIDRNDSSSDDDLETELVIADEWFSGRIRGRYTPQTEAHVKALMNLLTRNKPVHELVPIQWEVYSLKGDFEINFPKADGFFSRHYGRFEGYAENSWLGKPEKDTREFETMAPVFGIRARSHSLASRIGDVDTKDQAGVDSAVEAAFKGTFKTIGNFTSFCLGYLRTRVLNSHAQKDWGMAGDDYDLRNRNFRRMWGAVSYFSLKVFGDLLEPISVSSRTLMPAQYLPPDGDVPTGTSSLPLQSRLSYDH